MLDIHIEQLAPVDTAPPLTSTFVVGKAGFEPAASASRTLRANQAALLPVVRRPGPGDRTRRRPHDDLGDAPPVHGLDAELPTLSLDPVAFAGDPAEGIEEESAQADVLAFGEGRAELQPERLDGAGPVDQPPGAVDPGDLVLLVLVELVRQLPDQRADQVLDGENALDPAVLVEHHGEGDVALAHL